MLANYVMYNYRPSDVHARDNKGRTPFLLACEHARTDLARKLLDAKSGTVSYIIKVAISASFCLLDVYAVDNSQMTALHYLSASNSDRIEDFLTHISKQYACMLVSKFIAVPT